MDKSTIDYISLKLDFITATDPIIYVNGQYAWQAIGDYSGNSVDLDVTSKGINGTNEIVVKTSNNATIDYKLYVFNSENLDEIPEHRQINTINYILSGKDEIFYPTEVRVYVWR